MINEATNLVLKLLGSYTYGYTVQQYAIFFFLNVAAIYSPYVDIVCYNWLNERVEPLFFVLKGA